MSPVKQAVLPLKADAIARAEQKAEITIRVIKDALAHGGWDIDKVAPYPKGSDSKYHEKMSKRCLYESVTTWTKSSRAMHEPNIRKEHPEAETRFIQASKENAAAQYDAFIEKLEDKIGLHRSASLQGNHVWSYSILTVELETGDIQRWKTQQIINVSKLGKLFNQWPSRKIK